mgnify:CR=1 FL=1
MTIDKREKTVIVTSSKDTFEDLNSFINEYYTTFSNKNLILDLSKNKKIKEEELYNFEQLQEKQFLIEKSFVLVARNIDFDTVGDTVMVVPSLTEAFDMVDMEEIERDLLKEE